MSQSNSNSKSAQNYGGPIWGATFTVVWVIAVGSLFSVLLGAFDQETPDIESMRTAAIDLIWPFVALALGVPIIVFIWFGGYQAISRLADMRKHLDRLGQYTNDFERMSETAAQLKGHMEGASESVAKASNSINSNFEDFETVISPKIDQFIATAKASLSQNITAIGTTESSAQSSDKLLVSFEMLHSLANDMFYEVLDHRNASPGRGRNQLVVARGGWDKSRLVSKLQEEQRFKQQTAADLSRVFELEAKTRRWGRETIATEEILELYNRLKVAWDEYQAAEPFE